MVVFKMDHCEAPAGCHTKKLRVNSFWLLCPTKWLSGTTITSFRNTCYQLVSQLTGMNIILINLITQPKVWDCWSGVDWYDYHRTIGLDHTTPTTFTPNCNHQTLLVNKTCSTEHKTFHSLYAVEQKLKKIKRDNSKKICNYC